MSSGISEGRAGPFILVVEGSEEPPGAKMSTQAVLLYGRTVRALRNYTRASLDKQPARHPPASERGAGAAAKRERRRH